MSERITLGGGCFWCVEAVFRRIPGVLSVQSGYAGGTTENPSYKEVCSGRTGHAEVVQVEFDPEVLSPARIFDQFFQSHDPTTLNRQGADVGTQYRSVIYFETPQQGELAGERMAAAAAHYRDPIVTEIAPLDRFYPAEPYHQNYFDTNPRAGYCAMVIRPKLHTLRLQ